MLPFNLLLFDKSNTLYVHDFLLIVPCGSLLQRQLISSVQVVVITYQRVTDALLQAVSYTKDSTKETTPQDPEPEPLQVH